MFVIGKTFGFSASHRLQHLPVGHPCYNDHGHNYRVTLVLVAEDLDLEHDWVVDYGDLAPFKQWITNTLDHGGVARNTLNEVVAKVPMDDLMVMGSTRWTAEELQRVGFDRSPQPTAEVLAYYIYQVVKGSGDWEWAEYVHTVVVQETDKTMAAYAGGSVPIVWGSWAS